MLGTVFGVMCLLSIGYGVFSGNVAVLGEAVLDGAGDAVTLTLSLVGIMCLWCGVMQVLRDAGAIRAVTRLIAPLLRVFFPDAYRTGAGTEEIAASISANLLGIGNAATPLALAAMRRLSQAHVAGGGERETASADMITLAVLNTASANFLPTTILALRRAAGAARPFAVVLPIQICSLTCALFALCLTRAAGRAVAPGTERGK